MQPRTIRLLERLCLYTCPLRGLTAEYRLGQWNTRPEGHHGIHSRYTCSDRAYKQVLPGDKDTATTTGTPTASPNDDAAEPLRHLPPRHAGGDDLVAQPVCLGVHPQRHRCHIYIYIYIYSCDCCRGHSLYEISQGCGNHRIVDA